MNINGLIAVGWVLFWTGRGLTSVHEQMPMLTEPKTYGWPVPFGLFTMTGFAVLFGYLWGKE